MNNVKVKAMGSAGKLSRSKIELYKECPRCFWLDVKKGIKRPPPAPYTINSAIDHLLKQEFDVYRGQGKPHPLMKEHEIDAVPFSSPEFPKWRSNFTGVQYHDPETDFLIFGAIDDVWINPKGEIIIVDYKATGANQHQIYDSYRRQLEVYQWLFRKNGFKVSPTGYFVFARVNKANGFNKEGKALLNFDMFIEPQEGEDDWIPAAVSGARKILDSAVPPPAGDNCQYCEYQAGAFGVLGK